MALKIWLWFCTKLTLPVRKGFKHASCYGGWEVALPETEAFGCNCSGTLRFVILGPQTFCTEQGVTSLSCLLQEWWLI